MADPMQALSKATGISADPYGPSQIRRGEMPLTPGNVQSLIPMLESLGKPISELLGLILRPTASGTGLPSRLRFSNWNADTGEAMLHGTRKAVEPFAASPKDLDTMINAGQLDVEQPAATAVESIRRKLASVLGPSPGQ